MSVGVAASAAFPILLSPVNLQDFSYPQCPGNPPPQQWITTELQQPAPRYLNPDAREAARYANALRHGSGAFRDIRYLHLLDGGLADNLGVHSLMDIIASPHATVPVLRALNEGRLRRLVVITVRARSSSPSPLYLQARTPGIVAMLNSVTSNPIDAATSSIAGQKEVLLDQIRSAASAAANSAEFQGLSIYDVDVDFDQLLPEQSNLQRAVESVLTSWTITSTNLANIKMAAALLLRQHPCFQKLLVDSGQTLPANAPLANIACPQSLAAPSATGIPGRRISLQ